MLLSLKKLILVSPKYTSNSFIFLFLSTEMATTEGPLLCEIVPFQEPLHIRISLPFLKIYFKLDMFFTIKLGTHGSRAGKPLK